MIEIPANVQIRSTIKPGSVFLFIEESFKVEYPHFFIVINKTPIDEDLILLVASSSKVEKVKRRRRNLPDTIVAISKEEYGPFSGDSIIDCNEVIDKSTYKLIRKLEKSELQRKKEMPLKIVAKLRRAVCSSPIVDKWKIDMLT